MKWYNEDKTAMIDLNKIGIFHYSIVEDTPELILFVDGVECRKYGKQAKEIYNLIINHNI